MLVSSGHSADFANWLKVEGCEGVYQLVVESLDPKFAYTNCFAVHDGGKWLIVDSQVYSVEGVELMLAALDELGASSEDVSFFLTHTHSDHAGLVADVSQGSKVYLGFAEFPFVGQGAWKALERRYVDRAHLEGFEGQDASCFAKIHEVMTPCLVPPCNLVPLFEGDVVEVGSRRFTTISTPGHSPGHVVLFEEETGLLFSGDLVLPDVSPFIDVSPGGSDTWQDYMDSLKRVRSLPVKTFLQSHGPLGFQGMEKIDWLIKHHLERLDEVVEIVSHADEVTGYDVIKAVSWSVKAPSWEKIPQMTRGFMLCEGASILEHLVRVGVLAWDVDERGVCKYSVA